jgi:hypothetical protein
MRFRLAGGWDLATAVLIGGGAVLLAASIVAAVVLLTPAPPAQPTAVVQPAPTLTREASRPSAALPPDRVATVLYVDAGAGGGSVARMGDRVDVLGYFSRQVTGSENVTRTLLQDVPVLSVDRSGGNVALTLALPQNDALLLQEAQALGARALVTLRPLAGTQDMAPASFSDGDLAVRLAGNR